MIPVGQTMVKHIMRHEAWVIFDKLRYFIHYRLFKMQRFVTNRSLKFVFSIMTVSDYLSFVLVYQYAPGQVDENEDTCPRARELKITFASGCWHLVLAPSAVGFFQCLN